MVSLNEKRSKTRYIVQNKTAWVEDGNKFGKKMLEKMGWQSGAGLGKNEDGRTEHIDLKFKDNLKGVGFTNGKYDETWIAHSQSFDSVLQQLQQSHPSNSQSTLNDFNQTIQQTKTRFHYKKQTSGKDLSSRTNNELDCIFGWNKSNEMKQQSDQDKPNEITSDNHYITSNQSIQDYFKQKSLKKAQKLFQHNQIEESSSSKQGIPPLDEEKANKSKKKKRDDQLETSPKRKEIEDPYPSSNLSELVGYKGWKIDSSVEQILKKQKKRKK